MLTNLVTIALYDNNGHSKKFCPILTEVLAFIVPFMTFTELVRFELVFMYQMYDILGSTKDQVVIQT